MIKALPHCQGTKIFFQLGQKMNLLPEKGDSKDKKIMKGIARLIYGFTLPFFTTIGMIYNAFCALVHGVCKSYLNFTKQTKKIMGMTEKEHAANAKIRFSFAIKEAAFSVLSEAIVPLYTLIPLTVLSLNRRIDLCCSGA